MSQRTRGVALALLAGVGWGTLGPFAKFVFTTGGGVFDAASLSVARALWALPVCLIAALFARPRGIRLSRADLVRFASAAILVGFGLNYLYQLGTQFTSAAHAVLFQGLAPLALAGAEAMLYRTKLDAPRVLGLGLGLAGVVAIASGRGEGSAAALAGDAIMLAWLAVFATYSLVTRSLTERYSPLFVSSAAWGGGFALVALAGAPIGPQAIAHTFYSPQVAGAVLGGIVLASALVAPLAHAAAVRAANLTLATAASQYAAIATGLLLSYALLGERLHPLALAGGALVVLGLATTFVPARNGARDA